MLCSVAREHGSSDLALSTGTPSCPSLAHLLTCLLTRARTYEISLWVGTLLTMATSDSGSAATTTKSRAAQGRSTDAPDTTPDPKAHTQQSKPETVHDTEGMPYFGRGAKEAKEAQLKIAERRPDENPPDVGTVMGEEGKRHLSLAEKAGSAEYDETQEDVNKDLWERAALTPAEKAEKGILPLGTAVPVVPGK